MATLSAALRLAIKLDDAAKVEALAPLFLDKLPEAHDAPADTWLFVAGQALLAGEALARFESQRSLPAAFAPGRARNACLRPSP